jgi:integrase
MSLTDRFIASLEAPQAGQKTYLDKSIKGFGVRISQGGSKAFVLVHGKERRRITIGHYPIITLAQARAEAKKILAETTLGRELDAMSYDEALDLYCRHHLAFKSKAHRIEAERLLSRHFAFKTLEQIDRKAVVPILDDLTPSIRDHALRRLKAFLNWCVDRDYIPNNPLLRLKAGVSTTKRDRVLTDTEIASIWRTAQNLGNYGAVVQLLVCTGARRSEISNLRPEWIQKDLLVIPKEITKAKREHVMPLTTISMSILSRQNACSTSSTGGSTSGLIFPANGLPTTPLSGWSKLKQKLDKLSGVTDWVHHDTRRYFRTSLIRWGCCTAEIAERLIGHKVGGDVFNIYDRYDRLPEKREAMQKYTERLQAVIA